MNVNFSRRRGIGGRKQTAVTTYNYSLQRKNRGDDRAALADETLILPCK